VLAIPSQEPGVLDRYGITRAEADRAAWSIDSHGTRLEGAAAINRVLDELGTGWSALAAPSRLRPMAAFEEAAYRWFAPRRSLFHRLGIRPACDEPGAHCT
jgi:predicted DCC family thiol-disulfide oxidoreductase YuxK